MGGLGRKVPLDWEHYEKYALRDKVQISATRVEHKIPAVYPYEIWDQGREGACVGFGCSRMMSILNRELYDVLWLYREAQLNDEWDDTPPGEGTSVRAALEILRTKGHKDYDIPEPKREAGITEYRWASTVDEVRGLIALNIPVVIGVNWYSNFDNPVTYNGESWVGRTKNLGYVRGGHCVCIHGASDKRQAVRFLNSWGPAYPPTWLPYKKLQRLINEDGEVGLVTDFPGDPDPGDYIWKS